MTTGKAYAPYLVLAALLGSILWTACAPESGYAGKAYVREADGSVGPAIEGVTITFLSEEGGGAAEVETDADGAYRIALEPGRYWVRATHQDYADYSSIPGFFVVTGNGYDTGNVFLQTPSVTSVLLLRHADRDNDHLSPAGQERATKLAHVAQKAGVTAIYVTNTNRSPATAGPLAEALHLTPTQYCYVQPCGNLVDQAGLVGQILAEHRGDVVLVVGHGDTVPDLARRFGANLQTTGLPDFDNLFVLSHRVQDGAVNLVNLQYGEPSSPDSQAASSYPMTTVLLAQDVEGGQSGTTRAERLRDAALKAHKAGMTALYATGQPASQQTLGPLSTALNLSIQPYDPGDVGGFVQRIVSDHAGQLVIVAANRATIEEMIRALGGSPFPILYPDEFDNLLVITAHAPGQARVIGLQYGAPSP